MESNARSASKEAATVRAAPSRRWRWMRWSAIAICLLAAFPIYRYITRDRPLQSVRLPDGGTLELWEIAAPNHWSEYIVRREFPASPNLRQYLKPYLGRWADELKARHRWQEGVVVWLSARDAEGEPTGMDWLSHAVLRDERGWGHPLRSTSLHVVSGSSTGRVVASQHSPAPGNLAGIATPRDAHLVSVPAMNRSTALRTIIGLGFPSIPGQEVRLELYDRDGRPAAEFPMVTPPRQKPLPPTPFQGIVLQRHFEKVTVSLEGLDIRLLPENPAGLQTYEVRPRLAFRDNRPTPAVWNYPDDQGFAMFDDFENHGWSRWSALSPYSSTWRIRVVVPNPIEPEDCWRSGPLRVPGAGEVVDLVESGEIGRDEIQLLKILGGGPKSITNVQLRGRLAEESIWEPHPGELPPPPGPPVWSVALPAHEGATLLLTAGRVNGIREHSYRVRTSDGREFAAKDDPAPAARKVRVLRLPTDLAPGTEFTLECIIQQRISCGFVIEPPLNEWLSKAEDTPSTTSRLLDAKRKPQQEGE